VGLCFQEPSMCVLPPALCLCLVSSLAPRAACHLHVSPALSPSPCVISVCAGLWTFLATRSMALYPRTSVASLASRESPHRCSSEGTSPDHRPPPPPSPSSCLPYCTRCRVFGYASVLLICLCSSCVLPEWLSFDHGCCVFD
jgi:hypothetical protein